MPCSGLPTVPDGACFPPDSMETAGGDAATACVAVAATGRPG